MRFGVGLPSYGAGASVKGIVRVAQAAEDLGYASVWTTDHVLVPQANADPFGLIYEVITTLAFVAGRTQRVQLGTSVIILPQRNAIITAKQLATLDALSSGRVICGLGPGWMAGEFEYLRADFHRRGKILDEQIALLRELWSSPSPSFQGETAQFEHAVFEPKPAQKGGPPIWVGGQSDAALARAARLADGWHPNAMPPKWFSSRAARLRELAGERRITLSMRISVDLDSGKPSDWIAPNGEPRMRLTGSLDEAEQTLTEFAAEGLDHPVLFFPQADLGVMLAQMERFAREALPRLQG